MFLTKLKKILLLLILNQNVYGYEAPRTVMVQLFQWPWKEIARECELYLGPVGFAAVQISPPNETLIVANHPWWESYQPASYIIHNRLGTELEFQDMINRCRRVGVQIYADVVLNHMTGAESGRGTAGSEVSHYEYPGIYNNNDFHHCGRNGNDDLINYKDLYEVQNCELVNLADLNSSSLKVQQTQIQYLNRLVSMGVTGFRVDAAKHISVRDLDSIISKVQFSPYIIFELILGEEGLHYKDYSYLGDVNVFEVPFLIGQAFQKKMLRSLFKIMPNNMLPSSESAVVFIENHDLQRIDSPLILSLQKNSVLYRLAQVFLLGWPYGYPQLFSGYKFSNFNEGPPLESSGYVKKILSPNGNSCEEPWLCEHRLPEIRKMVEFRNQTNSYFAASNLWSDSSERIAFGRGPYGMVLINGSNSPWQVRIPTQMEMGSYCNILDPGFEPLRTRCLNPSVKVSGDRMLETEVKPLQAVVIQKGMKLLR